MKITSLKKQCAILAVSAGVAFYSAVGADRVVTETRQTTTRGTISAFEPNSIIIKSESAPDPVTYSFSKTTRYVDESGQVVARETIRPGMPATVHYVREGDRMIADRVVVGKTTTTTTLTEPGREPTRKEAKALKDAAKHPEREARRAAEKGKPFPPVDPSVSKSTTTTTTTNSDGTVSSFAADHFVMRTGDQPVTYRYSKTTQYVDDEGAPVSVEIVKSGVPVTVSYVREGDGFIAQRVIVHKRR